VIFQEEYLKLTLSLSIKKDPDFIYQTGFHEVSLGEGQNKFLYEVFQKKENKIPIKVNKVNSQSCEITLFVHDETKAVSCEEFDIEESTLHIKKESSKKNKVLNSEVSVEWSDGQIVNWRLVLGEGKKSHIVKKTKKKDAVHIEKRTVDTAKYCYAMNCPICGEIRYCKPASLKLVNLCNACALDKTRKKKADYVRRKRSNK
jgi:hypothetical protein